MVQFNSSNYLKAAARVAFWPVRVAPRPVTVAPRPVTVATRPMRASSLRPVPRPSTAKLHKFDLGLN